VKISGWCVLILVLLAVIVWLATLDEEDFARSWAKVKKD